MRVHISYSLPIMKQHEHRYQDHPGFACINSSTLANLLDSMDEDEFNKHYLIVDCRYPYEYDGGHILVNFTLLFISYKL